MSRFTVAKTLGAAAIAVLVSGPAIADSHGVDLTASGDAAKGEKAFKQCQSCHVVRNADGEVLAGRKAKTGPNLFGMVGGAAGSVEGFRYSKSLSAAGEAGLIWDEAAFVAYVSDPTKYLRAYLDDSKARGKMTFKVRKEADALNLYAFLQQFAAEAAAE